MSIARQRYWKWKGGSKLGTFYTIGIINKFWAEATQGDPKRIARAHLPLTEEEWIKVLDKRIDTSIFDLKMEETGTMIGYLKNDVFKENIKGFYDILREILGERRNVNIDHYEKEMYKDGELPDINTDQGYDRTYSYEWADHINIIVKDGFGIRIECQFIMLMLEGKVLVEEFYTDPILINYLFRNSKLNNPLCGAVISQVVG